MYTQTDKITDYVTIEMENGDKITVKLDSSAAPVTVENFKKLVSGNFSLS